jgi:hypothetical protein
MMFQLTHGQICRLEGGMSPQQRDATIQHFSELIRSCFRAKAYVFSEQYPRHSVPDLAQSRRCRPQSHRSVHGIHDGFMVEPFCRVSSDGPDSPIGTEETCQGGEAGYRG